MFFPLYAANFVNRFSFESAKRFKISVMLERISVPYYPISGNDLVIKLCPNLSFRCLPLSHSVFLKVSERIDLQLFYSNSLFPAFLTYFFIKKNQKLVDFFKK